MNAKLQSAAILAIGTELTDGQIVNTNAAWMAAQLFDQGIRCSLHIVTPDHKLAMFQALELCRQSASLVFVSGGLGPTSDDITREVIAEWLGLDLNFNPLAWEDLKGKMAKRGVVVAESNRKQCYFPKDSEVLANGIGTADGFLLTQDGFKLWALPGPKVELHHIWQAHIQPRLQGFLPDAQKTVLHQWQTIGCSESRLAEIVDETLAGSQLEIGYRSHVPIVEVKVWCPATDVAANQIWFDRLDAAISEWVVNRGPEDIGLRFLDALPKKVQLEITDIGTNGQLSQRLASLLAAHKPNQLLKQLTLLTQWEKPYDSRRMIQELLDLAQPSILSLAVCAEENFQNWSLGVAYDGQVKVTTYKETYSRTIMEDRGTRIICEKSFVAWRKMLGEFSAH